MPLSEFELRISWWRAADRADRAWSFSNVSMSLRSFSCAASRSSQAFDSSAVSLRFSAPALSVRAFICSTFLEILRDSSSAGVGGVAEREKARATGTMSVWCLRPRAFVGRSAASYDVTTG